MVMCSILHNKFILVAVVSSMEFPVSCFYMLCFEYVCVHHFDTRVISKTLSYDSKVIFIVRKEIEVVNL